MNSFQEKIKKAVLATNDVITYPDSELLLSNAKNQMARCHLSIKKSTKITLILVAILALLTAGMVSYQYMFADGKGNYGKAQEKGYVNIYKDLSITHDKITVKPKAILSDGMTTYVRLSFDGLSNASFNDTVSIKGQPFMTNTKGILSHINEAILSDNTGNTWNYKVQTVYSSDHGNSFSINPTLISDNLKENEAILTFLGAPKTSSTIFNLELSLKDNKTPFVFKGLEAKIAPVVVRNLQSYNLEYNIPGAKEFIKSVSHTVLQTTIEIEWTIDPQKLQEINDYCYRYVYLIHEADKKSNINLDAKTDGVIVHPAFLPGYSSENLKKNNATFLDKIVIPAISSEQDLVIDVYDKTKDGYKYVKKLLTIPK